MRLPRLCCGLSLENAETVAIIVPANPPSPFFFSYLQSQASRPEQSVMQALESLTETQVRRITPPDSEQTSSLVM